MESASRTEALKVRPAATSRGVVVRVGVADRLLPPPGFSAYLLL